MDPLSALAIAAAVVQFVDYATPLVKRILEPKKSPDKQPIDIAQTGRDLTALNDQVQSLTKLTTRSSEAEDIFIRHCATCAEIGKELRECLKEPTIEDVKQEDGLGTKWTVARRALKETLSGDTSKRKLASLLKRRTERIESLRMRLDEVQKQMVSAALIHLWANTKHIDGNETSPSEPSSSRHGQLNIELLDPAQQAGSSHEDHIRNHTFSSGVMRNAWALLRLGRKFSDATFHPELVPDVQLIKQQDKGMCRHALVHCIFFEHLGHRGGAIAPAHAQTFSWIFQSPQVNGVEDTSYSSFPDWLRGTDPANKLYWITGKPGAGKSTLMKFIVDNKKTHYYLRKWAAGQPLLVLDFYFWLAGNDLQRSREGLLRTMLFLALINQHDLIPRLFPQRWTLAKLYGLPALGLEWEFDELLQGFRAFIRLSIEKGKVAIFIDGLDEFQGDHQALVNLVQEMADLPNVKICVTSRPWSEFRDAFSKGPSLQVEHLTAPDINLYVRDHLSQSEGFRELQAIHVASARRLVTDVVTKSQGVFLWVKVVVNALLHRLRAGDRLEDLERTLIRLPEELTNLFDAIWSGIEPQYYSETAQYLQMVKAADEVGLSLDAFGVWLTDDEYDIHMATSEVQLIDVNVAVQALSRRLVSRTKGLIEIQRSLGSDSDRASQNAGVVTFMHRSVRDWASSQSSVQRLQPRVMQKDGLEFDPYLWILKGETLRLASHKSAADFNVLGPSSLHLFWPRISPLFHVAACVEEKEVNLSFLISALDRIDVELTRLARIRPVQKTKSSYPHGFSFFGIHWVSTHPPHWSNMKRISEVLLKRSGDIKFLRERDVGFLTDYIGFLSPFPLSSYIRSKILETPRLVNPANVINPGEAIVESPYFAFRDIVPPFIPSSDAGQKKLELLRFFLDQQVDIGPLRQRLANKGFIFDQDSKRVKQLAIDRREWNVLVSRVIDEYEKQGGKWRMGSFFK